jgi:site-specific recombinase XerD
MRHRRLSSPLTELLRDFLLHYLPRLRGLSPRTVAAYRDAMGTLLAFLRDRQGIPPGKATALDLTTDRILRFLDHLEDDRGNSRRTRNHRRAALRTFAKSLLLLGDDFRPPAERILAVPGKKERHSFPDVPTREEMNALFSAVDPRSPLGLRDLALLRFAYNSGARASEIADLRRPDLRLGEKAARVRGKGGAVRFCPLWDSTIGLLRCYLTHARGVPLAGGDREDVVFLSQRRRPLTRFGVRKIALRAFQRAAPRCRGIEQKRLSMHNIRHATGSHLLEAGVELNVIQAWLGHKRQETTALYLQLSNRARREALERSRVLELDWLESDEDNAVWGTDPETLRWLDRW